MPLYNWLLLILAVLAAGVYLWYTRHATAADVLRGEIPVPPEEAAALDALLTAAGVSGRAVRAIQTEPDVPCWSHRYRHWIDHRLGVYRQFGRFGHNALGLEGGHIVGLSLVEVPLAEAAPLAHLPHLRHLQLRDAHLRDLTHALPPDCRWTHLNLSGNQLDDADFLTRCPNLREVDLSFNRIARLPDLRALPHLERLDVRQNRLGDLRALAGHPALQWLDAAGNRLTTAEGLAGLPWLATLHLGSNALTALDGLHDLPALTSLYLAANRLEALDAEILLALPMLRHVSLAGNPLRTLPPGFAPAGPATLARADGTPPRLDVSQTPLALQKAGEERSG